MSLRRDGSGTKLLFDDSPEAHGQADGRHPCRRSVASLHSFATIYIAQHQITTRARCQFCLNYFSAKCAVGDLPASDTTAAALEPTFARLWFDHRFIRIGNGCTIRQRPGNAQTVSRRLAIWQSSAMSRHWERAKRAGRSTRSGQYPIQKKSGRNAFPYCRRSPVLQNVRLATPEPWSCPPGLRAGRFQP